MTHIRLLTLHAITPIHVGTGRGEGVIDLPIARDSVTQHPIIPGSGVKGALRAVADSEESPVKRPEARSAFGPPPESAHEYASALRFSDARLLALPVNADHGTFAWVTSPFVLARLRRDAGSIVDLPSDLPIPGDAALHAEGAVVSRANRVVLDGVEYSSGRLEEWAAVLAPLVFPEDALWRTMFEQRLVIVADDAFDQLARDGTDVRAHIRIDPETGVVHDGALWYEESVPAESVFTAVVQSVGNHHCAAEAGIAVLEEVLAEDVTFGGGKTTGMGLMRPSLHGGKR